LEGGGEELDLGMGAEDEIEDDGEVADEEDAGHAE
jgi:hypothetical protein